MIGIILKIVMSQRVDRGEVDPFQKREKERERR